ncbi:hypothetical protein KUF71_013547 [Frankliniella fusca]|uniref:Uncharacterized protein n=1 Tax=Frankliniella fusca TaxID=407009 RepID=A0AAE1LMY4_9NEOP|nr:hypothetical protein KUF71_013547 [Frankliniella fusca]
MVFPAKEQYIPPCCSREISIGLGVAVGEQRERERAVVGAVVRGQRRAVGLRGPGGGALPQLQGPVGHRGRGAPVVVKPAAREVCQVRMVCKRKFDGSHQNQGETKRRYQNTWSNSPNSHQHLNSAYGVGMNGGGFGGSAEPQFFQDTYTPWS